MLYVYTRPAPAPAPKVLDVPALLAEGWQWVKPWETYNFCLLVPPDNDPRTHQCTRWITVEKETESTPRLMVPSYAWR